MGYRYGERTYSAGLYSRWPDWWHGKTCVQDDWTPALCGPDVWQPSTPGRPAWEPLSAVRRPVERRVFAVGARRGQ